MRRLLPLAALLIVATAAGFALLPQGSTRPDRPAAGELPSATAPSVARHAAPSLHHSVVRAARYRMTYSARWGADDSAAFELSGRWTQQTMPDGRIRIDLSAIQASAHDALPDPSALETRFALLLDDGRLDGVAAPPDADALTRRTLAMLAATFWATPLQAADRVVTESDLTGRYAARYTRDGSTLIRRVEAYTAVRGPKGLDTHGARSLEPAGASRFTYDAQGLVRADVSTRLTTKINGESALTLTVTARLVREAARPADLIAADLRANRFADLVDFQGIDDQMDSQLLDGATVARLLAELSRPERLDMGTKAGRDARGLLLQRLSAAVRLDPEAAGPIAQRIKARVAAGQPVGLLIGALSSANAPAATDALADLVDALDGRAQRDVINGLTLTDAVTDHSLSVLTDALDGEQARAAALALGSQSRKASEDAPEAARSAVEQLLEGLATARSPSERAMYIRALGNAGDRQALPALRHVIETDLNLAPSAVYALRFMPGADVDTLLEEHIKAIGLTFQGALNAVALRDGARWAPVLQQLADALNQVEHPPAAPLEAIEKLLARWG